MKTLLLFGVVILLSKVVFAAECNYTLIARIGRTDQEQVLYRPILSTNVESLNLTKINKVFPAPNMRLLQPNEWLAPDAEFAEQTKLRDELYAHRPNDILQVLPGYEEKVRLASEEVLRKIVTHLTTEFPNQYKIENGEVLNIPTGSKIVLADKSVHPLAKAGLLVQDDLTLTMLDTRGRPRMVAGFVATPTNWSVADFLGQTINQIHGSVQNYESIKKPVQGAVMQPVPGKLIGRNNWFVVTNPSLALPSYQRPVFKGAKVVPSNVPDRLFLRSETESIVMLPETRAVLFSIRPRVWSFRFVKENAPEKAQELAEGIAAKGSGYADYIPLVVPYLTNSQSK